MKIEVKQEHIDQGYRCRAYECALAMAFREALGVDAWVSGGCVGFDEKHVYELPTVADNFYHDFDNFRPVVPFSFEMDIPEAVAGG